MKIQYTQRVVDTPTYVVIIGNETIFVDVGDVVIDAVVLDDNNNSIVGGNLVFFVNNELMPAVLEKTVYKANYTVVPSNQTINAVYDDIGLLNITNKYGIIMGRVMPNITAEDVEFNISGEFKVELSYNNTPISGADLVVKIDGKEYSVKTDSNGTATLNLELGAGKHIADIIFNGTELYSATAGQANITVYKFVSEISVNVEDIYLHEDAIINITLPDDATGDIIVTVGGKDYNAKASNGNVLIAIPNLGEGEYSAIVDYYGDERYLNAFARTTFKVKSDKQEEKDNKTSKTTMVFNFSVPDGISGNVTVLVDGKEVAVVYVTDGKGSVVLTDLGDGNHTFDVKYDMDVPENNGTVPTNNTAVVKKDTVIVVDPAFTRVANDYYVGERGAFFYAILKDSEGNVLVNKTVSIAVNGPIYNVTTDDQGRAGLQVNFMNANIYTYALAFAGDDEYNATQLASSKLTITKKSTSITAAAKSYKVKATKKYTVTLKTAKNPYNGKTYLKSGKKLTLKVKGKTYTAKINSKGKATFTLKLTKKGKFTAKIKFAGDKTYKASSKSVKITVK